MQNNIALVGLLFDQSGRGMSQQHAKLIHNKDHTLTRPTSSASGHFLKRSQVQLANHLTSSV
jgi:hypothetical protein